MDSIVELVKRNEQLLLENAEALNDEEVEQEDIDEYLKIQGATKEELSAFENQFQIRLPEDFKIVYSYKNGSGYMSLIWPQEGFYRGYRLLSLKEIIKLKSLFQNKNCKMTEFPNVIGEKQLQQLDERIKPYLFCERWFPFAEYAGSLYLMLDYNPSEKGEIGQIICYVHDKAIRGRKEVAEKDCTEVGLAEKSEPAAGEEIKEIYYGGNTDEILGQRQKTG